jgi:uncharacterized membrane protein HdeD (DUF308 family)
MSINPALGMFGVVYIFTIPLLIAGIVTTVFGLQLKQQLKQ